MASSIAHRPARAKDTPGPQIDQLPAIAVSTFAATKHNAYMAIRAVLLDLDDTLVDSAPVRAVALTCRDLAATWPGLDEASLLAANRATFPVYLKEVEAAWMLGGISG